MKHFIKWFEIVIISCLVKATFLLYISLLEWNIKETEAIYQVKTFQFGVEHTDEDG